jgi:hypothetical protein
MPYNIRKANCKQSSGKKGSYTLSYTDNKGKKHRACHTSRKKARGQIAAIEMPEGDESPSEDTVIESLKEFMSEVLQAI